MDPSNNAYMIPIVGTKYDCGDNLECSCGVAQICPQIGAHRLITVCQAVSTSENVAELLYLFAVVGHMCPSQTL